MKSSWVVAVVALMLGFGCKKERSGASSAPPKAKVQAAKASVAAVKKRLKATLMTEMKKGGPAGALSACRLEAGALTAAAQTNDIRVGRTSHKLRNPGNIAPEWVAPIVAEWAKSNPAAGAVKTVDLGKGKTGYVEAIHVMPPCLACHGKPPEAVASLLAEHYPKDQATGFGEGDFRGVFWAEVK